jgi:hypothetical protein
VQTAESELRKERRGETTTERTAHDKTVGHVEPNLVNRKNWQFVVRDHNWQVLAYVYEDARARRSAN